MNKLLSLLSLAILLSACGGGATSRLNPSVQDPTSTLFPAVDNAPYAQHLVACAYIYNRNGNNNFNFCPLNRLPLLGQEHEQIGVDEIMNRTVVSHSWMATRFEQLLDELPDDLLQLFQATTAVVIGADIRPSYYWSATGAIYLDPASLWLTAAERNTISRAPDYRSDFAQELDFVSWARYVNGNQRAWQSYSLTGGASSRPLSQIVLPMASLLFHELAHANDFVPPAQISQLEAYTGMPLWQAAIELDVTISEVLEREQPLHSDLLYDLADVMYNGETASSELRAIGAQQVGLAFEEDGASDDYAYSSLFEDTAMLFEEVMMKFHFDIDREVAYSDVPSSSAPYCDDYIVRWGVRHRIGEPLVKQRAEIILRELLNQPDVSTYLADLPEPVSLINNLGWCENLEQFGTTGIQGFTLQQQQDRPVPEDDRVRPGHQDGHPGHDLPGINRHQH